MGKGDLAVDQAQKVECDLAKEIASRVGYEYGVDDRSSEGDGSGSGGAAAPTWEELWADVGRSGLGGCGMVEAAASKGRRVERAVSGGGGLKGAGNRDSGAAMMVRSRVGRSAWKKMWDLWLRDLVGP